MRIQEQNWGWEYGNGIGNIDIKNAGNSRGTGNTGTETGQGIWDWEYGTGTGNETGSGIRDGTSSVVTRCCGFSVG